MFYQNPGRLFKQYQRPTTHLAPQHQNTHTHQRQYHPPQILIPERHPAFQILTLIQMLAFALRKLSHYHQNKKGSLHL